MGEGIGWEDGQECRDRHSRQSDPKGLDFSILSCCWDRLA